MLDAPSTIQLHHGNCLEKMKLIPSHSVDLVLTDPPYGVTAAPWDTVIPYAEMWSELRRVAKPNGVIALFGNQPFTSTMIASNYAMFKYCWYWRKNQHSNPFLARIQPLRIVEDIMIFYRGKPTYNHGAKKIHKVAMGGSSGLFDAVPGPYIQTGTGYPNNVLEYARERGFHPTQKPVPLLEYLVGVYTNPGDTVLDFTMGSGSTGVACRNKDRRFIGIELNDLYYGVARERIGV